MPHSSSVTLVECPRDAMQGWPKQISTEAKIAYLNQLLRVGFHTIDCVSFVSPQAIPQMADSAAVLRQLTIAKNESQLLAIVANKRGAEEAVLFSSIQFIGYPFSISPTFQLRNANCSMEESWLRVLDIQQLAVQNQKQLVVYLSMAFGNPYGDGYDAATITYWIQKLQDASIAIVSLADTVGLATKEEVYAVVEAAVVRFPDMQVGVHLHSTPDNALGKLQAAWDAGCTRFDGAIKGIGGCPMAGDNLVGNMNMETMVAWFEQKGIFTGVDKAALQIAVEHANTLFAS